MENNKLDWTFDEEELNPNEPPLKVGDQFNYSGPLKYYRIYKNKQFTDFRKIDKMSLSNKVVNHVKKYKDQWLFQFDFYSFWFIYDEKYLKIEKNIFMR